MNLIEQICYQELAKERPKKATMKTPYWQETIRRPLPQAILAYEIYSKQGNPSEKETIKALNALVRKGKARSFIDSKDWLWYVGVDSNEKAK